MTAIVPPVRSRCPACRGNTILLPRCTICWGKGEVYYVDKGDYHVEIHAIADDNTLDPTHFNAIEMNPTLFAREVLQSESPPIRVSLSIAYAHFERTCIPENAPQYQRVEMRRAWYSGVSWIFDSFMYGLDAGTEPTEADLHYMDEIHSELRAFAKKIADGIA